MSKSEALHENTSFTERLGASNGAKKAPLERAKRIAEDPERAE